MSAAARALARRAAARTDRQLFFRRWSTRRHLARLRRAGYAFAAFVALFGAPGVVGYFDLQEAVAAAEQDRDAALVAEADATIDAALASTCQPPLGFLIECSDQRECFDKLTAFHHALEYERVSKWVPVK